MDEVAQGYAWTDVSTGTIKLAWLPFGPSWTSN
jgi:hypothetical protein